MLSRVAQRMYWAGRYLERVEATARLVRIYDSLLLDLPNNSGMGWPQLLSIVTAEETFNSRYNETSSANVLGHLLADDDNPASLLASISHLRENVRTCRDIVPSEGWECVNELYLLAKEELPKANAPQGRYQTLDDCIERSQLMAGLISGTMSHGDAYNFWRIGGYLERADMTSRVVDVAAATLAEADDSTKELSNVLWMGVLKSVSAYQMYRQYVRRRVLPQDVVNFLLGDRKFPRAMGYSVVALTRALGNLPNAEALAPLLNNLASELDTVTQTAMGSAALHESIDRLQIGLAEINDEIFRTWFLNP